VCGVSCVVRVVCRACAVRVLCVLLEVGGTARPFSMAKVEHSVNTLSQTERQGSTTTQSPMMSVSASANAQGETLQGMVEARPACAHRWA
jgi:hypothetical protein